MMYWYLFPAVELLVYIPSALRRRWKPDGATCLVILSRRTVAFCDAVGGFGFGFPAARILFTLAR